MNEIKRIKRDRFKKGLVPMCTWHADTINSKFIPGFYFRFTRNVELLAAFNAKISRLSVPR